MIKVKETAPGCIDISCEVSGRPLTRTTQDGMFCDAKECQCEIESKMVAQDLRAMIKMFGGE
jgi:hypothetical protein